MFARLHIIYRLLSDDGLLAVQIDVPCLVVMPNADGIELNEFFFATEKLIRRIIALNTKKDDIVLDSFLGSGSSELRPCFQ